MRYELGFVLLLAACATDASVDSMANELSAPPELTVPEGNHVAATYHATGYQIYECKEAPAGGLAWGLRAPAAILLADDGALVAVHFGGIDAGLPAGPYWQSALDGSRVHGGGAISAPNPGSIPFLRLTALDNAGEGLFADVTFIQRLETEGGLAPTSTCRRAGTRSYVPYEATYVFWAGSLPRPEVPTTIAVPEGHDVAYVGHATGAQIYECALDATSTPAWRLRAPSAVLESDDVVFADHFGGVDADLPAGPYWRSLRDGSRVHGGNAISSPNPGSIALLRLQALDHAGNGIFSRVSYIHRLATEGGIGPTGACTLDARVEVPYAADYYFYVPVN
jgi:hypothetical protein